MKAPLHKPKRLLDKSKRALWGELETRDVYPDESQGMIVAGWPPLWYTPFVLGGIAGSLGTMQMQGRSDVQITSSCTHLVRGAVPL